MHICLAGCPGLLFDKQQHLAAGCPGCIIIFCHHYTPSRRLLALPAPSRPRLALVAGGNYKKPRRESDPGGVDPRPGSLRMQEIV